MHEKSNDFLYITPPDLFLPVDGARYYYLGGSDVWKKAIIKIAEDIHTLSGIGISHYYTPNPVSETEIPWVQACLSHADLVFVNFDLINPIEMAFACSRADFPNTIIYSEESKNQSILTVMNTVSRCPIMLKLDHVESFLREELKR